MITYVSHLPYGLQSPTCIRIYPQHTNSNFSNGNLLNHPRVNPQEPKLKQIKRSNLAQNISYTPKRHPHIGQHIFNVKLCSCDQKPNWFFNLLP